MPAKPSPLSATTTTPPARHTAYTAAVRSADGATSSATRWPGRSPAAASPAASSRTRRSSGVPADGGAAHLDDGGGQVAGALGQRRPEPAPALRRRGGGRGRRGVQVTHPLGDRGGVLRGVLGDQVGGALVAVQPRLRQPLAEVGEVPLPEDRVARAPQHQHRDVEVADAGRDGVDGGVGRVVGPERDVRDEVPDRPAPRGRGVRRGERPSHLPGEGGTRQRGGGLHEGRRPHAGEPAEQRHVGEPDQRRSLVVRRLRDRGVGEHDPMQLVAVRERPAERDRATPVVADGDDRAGDAERLGQRAQVGDPLGQRPRRVEALGPAHAEMVGGDDPPAGRRLGQQAPPQVGPGGVAVDAEQRPDRVGDAVVQDVPGAGDARRRRAP